MVSSCYSSMFSLLIIVLLLFRRLGYGIGILLIISGVMAGALLKGENITKTMRKLGRRRTSKSRHRTSTRNSKHR